jgi:hypothetical protein
MLLKYSFRDRNFCMRKYHEISHKILKLLSDDDDDDDDNND